MTRHDLARLADLAEADLSLFISRARQARSRFRKLVLCRALCQGAALHYIDHKNGVKDLDVYTFFRADKGKPWPYRRRGTADYGKPKFGIHPEDVGKLEGRRVDLLGRSIEKGRGENPVDAVLRYLENQKSGTAWHLAQKAVVIIEPREFRGRVIWPIGDGRRR